MKIVCTNNIASYEYFLLDKFVAGISLSGDEIKSVRAGNFSLKESFVIAKDNYVYLKNAYIAPYENAYDAKRQPIDPRRDRQLLLHKIEIKKLKKAREQEGLTIIPTKAFFDNHYLKVEIAIARGKKLFDKRESIKNRDLARSKSSNY